MANPTRILFVSDEVEPFSKSSATAHLVRTLPERLQESGEFEMRIMMPRYGTISERKNRLHEVIRLSGAEIEMGNRKETLKVKVASIPGIRLQVYFMDNNHYFKRKGLYRGKQGDVFEDNLERALFFGRSVLETIRSLGWSPDVVHSFGWMSGFLPALLRSEYAAEPLYEDAKTLYTPSQVDFEGTIDEDFAAGFASGIGSNLTGKDPVDLGIEQADIVIFPPSAEVESPDELRFSDSVDENVDVVRSAYEQLLSEVPA